MLPVVPNFQVAELTLETLVGTAGDTDIDNLLAKLLEKPQQVINRTPTRTPIRNFRNLRRKPVNA
jgi:hypothetical protein